LELSAAAATPAAAAGDLFFDVPITSERGYARNAEFSDSERGYARGRQEPSVERVDARSQVSSAVTRADARSKVLSAVLCQKWLSATTKIPKKILQMLNSTIVDSDRSAGSRTRLPVVGTTIPNLYTKTCRWGSRAILRISKKVL